MNRKRVPFVVSFSYIIRPSLLREFCVYPEKASQMLVDYSFLAFENPFYSFYHLPSFADEFKKVVAKILHKKLVKNYNRKTPLPLIDRIDGTLLKDFFKVSSRRVIESFVYAFSLTALLEMEFEENKGFKKSKEQGVLEYYEDTEESETEILFSLKELSSPEFASAFNQFITNGLVGVKIKGAVLSYVPVISISSSSRTIGNFFLSPIDVLYEKIGREYEPFSPFMRMMNLLHIPSNDFSSHNHLEKFLLGKILLRYPVDEKRANGRVGISRLLSYYKSNPYIRDFLESLLEQPAVFEGSKIKGKFFFPFSVVPAFTYSSLKDILSESSIASRNKNLLGSFEDRLLLDNGLFSSPLKRVLCSQVTSFASDYLSFYPLVFADGDDVKFCVTARPYHSGFVHESKIDKIFNVKVSSMVPFLLRMNDFYVKDEEGVVSLFYKFLKEATKLVVDEKSRNLPVMWLNSIFPDLQFSVSLEQKFFHGVDFAYHTCSVLDFFIRSVASTLEIDFDQQLASDLLKDTLQGELTSRIGRFSESVPDFREIDNSEIRKEVEL